jgi:hypothetical protein
LPNSLVSIQHREQKERGDAIVRDRDGKRDVENDDTDTERQLQREHGEHG